MAEDRRTKLGTGSHSAQPSAPAATPVPVTPSGTGAPDVGKASHLPASTPMPAVDHSKSYIPGPPQGDPLLGMTLAGRYLIVRKLGEGGMGAVYLATHLLLEKQVALKVLHNEFARKPDLVERFMQEAKAASRIRHENVIDISDFGTTPEGLVFFAMELLRGHDLHEEVARARLAGQLLPWARSKRIFLQICSALSAAHGKGIVHRDLKPENVYLVDFLGDPDFVKLLDFGIAKLTEVNEEGRKLTKTGMLFGTPEYMSPEQARGEHVDHRVDVYAMGCILFQLVTGRVPFEADNFMGVLSLHLTEPPPMIPPAVFERIGAPAELAAVIDTALAKPKEQRWQTIDDLANAVRIACGEAPLEPGRTAERAMAVRPASVPAPPVTKEARLPTPPPSTSPEGRVRTQWTGNLSVPEAPPDQPKKSKLPLVIAGGVIAAAAAVAVVFALRGGDKSKDDSIAQPNGSAPVGSQTVVTVDAAPEASLPPPAETVALTVKSEPPGATVVVGDKKFKTPQLIKIRGSHAPRTFTFTMRGYQEAIVEIVANQEKQEHVETLIKGEGTVTRTVKPPSVGSGSAIVKLPELGSGSAVIRLPDPPKTIDAGISLTPDDCDEPPCIKKKVKGHHCGIDTDCESPLKCIEGKCDFPKMVVPDP